MPDQHPIIGPIISGVVVGTILGVGGFLLGKATAPDVPPMAVISPEKATVTAGENIQFNAAASISFASSGILNTLGRLGVIPQHKAPSATVAREQVLISQLVS